MKNVSRISSFLLTLTVCYLFSNMSKLNCQILRLQNIRKEAPEPIFACPFSGNFQDTRSTRSYWYCDVSPDGSYVAIRRSCPNGQIFSRTQNICISEIKLKRHQSRDSDIGWKQEDIESCSGSDCNQSNPSTKNKTYIIILNEDEDSKKQCKGKEATTACSTSTKSFEETENPEDEFTGNVSCSQNKISGKVEPDIQRVSRFICNAEGAFPDPNNPSNFYICHKKRHLKSKYERYKIKCPSGLSFDDELGKCTKQAREDSENTKTFTSLFKVLQFMRNDMLHNQKQDFDTMHRKRYATREDTPNSAHTFRCTNPGRFADTTQPNRYYLCYPKNSGEGFLTLKLQCPAYSLFDANKLVCSRDMYFKYRRYNTHLE